MNAMRDETREDWTRNSEVLIEAESLASHFSLAASSRRRGNTSFRVFGDTLLEEVGLALERDHVHEVEWIADIVVLRAAKSNEEAIGDELNVLAHELSIHANETDGESI